MGGRFSSTKNAADNDQDKIMEADLPAIVNLVPETTVNPEVRKQDTQKPIVASGNSKNKIPAIYNTPDVSEKEPIEGQPSKAKKNEEFEKTASSNSKSSNLLQKRSKAAKKTFSVQPNTRSLHRIQSQSVSHSAPQLTQTQPLPQTSGTSSLVKEEITHFTVEETVAKVKPEARKSRGRPRKSSIVTKEAIKEVNKDTIKKVNNGTAKEDNNKTYKKVNKEAKKEETKNPGSKSKKRVVEEDSIVTTSKKRRISPPFTKVLKNQSLLNHEKQVAEHSKHTRHLRAHVKTASPEPNLPIRHYRRTVKPKTPELIDEDNTVVPSLSTQKHRKSRYEEVKETLNEKRRVQKGMNQVDKKTRIKTEEEHERKQNLLSEPMTFAENNNEKGKNRDERNERIRQKYHSDPEYRARRKLANALYRQRKNENKSKKA